MALFHYRFGFFGGGLGIGCGLALRQHFGNSLSATWIKTIFSVKALRREFEQSTARLHNDGNYSPTKDGDQLGPKQSC